MDTLSSDELLIQGIEDVRAGNRVAARQRLEKAVEIDENNEKAWMWLTSVVDTDEEKRICLGNVLHINPNNERARKALEALDLKDRNVSPQEGEVVPGITRRTLLLIIGAGAGVILIVVLLAYSSIATTNAEIQQATAYADASRTVQLANRTGTSTARTATAAAAVAMPMLTETIAPTLERPTLPPSWTPTALPTATATIAVLPPPVGVSGVLVAWGGRDLENSGFYPVGYYNLNGDMSYTIVNTDIGREPRLYPNGQRLVYTRYDRLFFGTTLDAINLNGQQLESLPERYRGQTIVQAPRMAAVSPDGTFVAFIGRASSGVDQIFVLSLVDNTLRNLTNDSVNYSYPDISPNGTQIVAVRSDISGGTGTDLAIIRVGDGGKFALTTDQDAYIETQPRWTRDGSQVVYASAPQSEPNNYDIVVLNIATGSAPSLLVRSPANDQFPVLDPSGNFLAFASDRNGNWDIFVLNIRTQALAQLSTDPEPNFPGDWR